MILPSGSPDMPTDPGDGDEMSWTDWLVVLAIVVLLIWLVITGIQWLGSYGNPSLEQVLRNQWEWAQNITITEGQKKARQERAWIARMTEYAVEMEQYEPNDGDERRYQRMYKILLPISTGSWNEPNKCWYHASSFFHVRVLVPAKCWNFNKNLVIDLIYHDKSSHVQLVEKFQNIAIVVWKNFCFDAFRPVFEASFSVGKAPKT